VLSVNSVAKNLVSNNTALLPGIIVAAHGKHYRAELDDGRIISCVTRGKKTGTACGDRVEIALTASDQGVIERIAERKTQLYRSDLYREKIIATNVDQIVIVVAAVPSFYEELINRCLVAAETSGIQALIVLNKIDLPESAAAQQTLALYASLGYPLLPLCAKQDVTPLRAALAHHSSVFVGQSGMGKSTLINALLPDANIREGDISAALDSGKHTTTQATLYHLDGDSSIIDSPGLQEFGLHHLQIEDIAQAFIEFRPFLGQCRFHNCRHMVEPGCALDSAEAEGKIDPRRLKVYRALAHEKLRAPRIYSA
jgi:ribosome biogenesis GTPase